MIETFSPQEMESFNAQRGGRRWWHSLTDRFPWSRYTRIMRRRYPGYRLLDSWVNPGDESWRLRGGGSFPYVEPLDSIIADGTQISNSTAETIVCPDFSIQPYYMAPGRTLRIWAFGVISNVVTTPGTLILQVRWGGVGGVVLLKSAAQGLDTTARTNALWCLSAHVVCRAAGASGSFMSGGFIHQINVLSTTAANLLPAMLGSAGAPLASGNIAVTGDTTVAKLLSVTATFSVATSPTNLTCQQRVLEVLG